MWPESIKRLETSDSTRRPTWMAKCLKIPTEEDGSHKPIMMDLLLLYGDHGSPYYTIKRKYFYWKELCSIWKIWLTRPVSPDLLYRVDGTPQKNPGHSANCRRFPPRPPLLKMPKIVFQPSQNVFRTHFLNILFFKGKIEYRRWIFDELLGRSFGLVMMGNLVKERGKKRRANESGCPCVGRMLLVSISRRRDIEKETMCWPNGHFSLCLFLQPRKTRRENKRAMDTSACCWKGYPVPPRGSVVFESHTCTRRTEFWWHPSTFFSLFRIIISVPALSPLFAYKNGDLFVLKMFPARPKNLDWNDVIRIHWDDGIIPGHVHPSRMWRYLIEALNPHVLIRSDRMSISYQSLKECMDAIVSSL